MNTAGGLRAPLTVLLFGAPGGARGSVLRVCLASPIVGTVRTITRRPVAITDAKLQPIVHEDFLDYSTVSASFAGVDACLFCLGLGHTWRPAYIDGEHSDNAPLMLKIWRPLFRLLKPFRSMYVAGEDIGLAMLQATLDGTRAGIIDNTELRFLADRTRAQR